MPDCVKVPRTVRNQLLWLSEKKREAISIVFVQMKWTMER